MDSDGSYLIRMDQDGPAKTNGPHIVAIQVERLADIYGGKTFVY